MAVRGFERVGDLQRERQQCGERKSTGSDQARQRRPSTNSIAMNCWPSRSSLAWIVDTRMAENGGRTRFAPKPFDGMTIAGKRWREELQRDEAAERQIFGLEDLAHSAGTELLDDPVMRNRGADHGRGRFYVAAARRCIKRSGYDSHPPVAPRSIAAELGK